MKLNVALALDHEQVVQELGPYIAQLQFCISVFPGYRDPSKPLRRGMMLSEQEVEAMKKMKEFYLPGFTSTSTDNPFRKKGFLIIEIDASEGERVTLDMANAPAEFKPKLTKYLSENEVLISCYTKFRYVDEVIEGGVRVGLKLKLLDPIEEHYEKSDIYQRAFRGDWDAVFNEIKSSPHKAQVMVRYAKPTSGWTLLHQAAWFGRQDVVNELMKLGADPNRKSKNDQKLKPNPTTPKEIVNERGSKIDWSEAELEGRKAEAWRAGTWLGQPLPKSSGGPCVVM